MNNIINFRARPNKAKVIHNFGRSLGKTTARSMSQTIVKQMNALEYRENNMLHYFNPDLEKRAWEAIDSMNLFKMGQIIKEFYRLL
jgi:hypothetical protein